MKKLFLLILIIISGYSLCYPQKNKKQVDTVITAEDLALKIGSDGKRLFAYSYFYLSETDLINKISKEKPSYTFYKRIITPNGIIISYKTNSESQDGTWWLNSFYFNESDGCYQSHLVGLTAKLPTIVNYIDNYDSNKRTEDLRWINLRQFLNVAITSPDEGDYFELVYAPLYEKKDMIYN